MSDERVTVSTEELTLTNTLTLTALDELLEQKGLLAEGDVIERMKTIQTRKGGV